MPVTNFPRTKLATAGEIATAVAEGDLIYKEPRLVIDSSKVVTELEVRSLVARRINASTTASFCTPWEDLYDDRFIALPIVPSNLPNYELTATETQTPSGAINLNVSNMAVMDGRVYVGFEMSNPLTLENNQVKIFNVQTHFTKVGDASFYTSNTVNLIDVGTGPRVVLIPSFPSIGLHGYETLHVSFGVAGLTAGKNITIRFVMWLIDIYGTKNFTSNWFNVGYNASTPS